jgi:hypothetical protein
VVGDWNGDGVTTVGVVDPSTMTWYLRDSNTAGLPSFTPFRYGLPGWTPVVGDWDGNGTTTIGVIDPNGNWYLRNSNTPGPPDIGPFPYGLGGWLPVAVGRTVPSPSLLVTRGIRAASPDGGAPSQAGSGAAPGLGGVYPVPADPAAKPVALDTAPAGWASYSEPPPLADSAFTAATSGGPLTTVPPEMGHLADLTDRDGPASAPDLNTYVLTTGTRRTDALDTVFAGGIA